MYIHELEQLLEVPRAKIFELEKELDLHPVTSKIHSTISFLFTDEEDERIISYFKNKELEARKKAAAEKIAKQKRYTEELARLKAEHPLVIDERCFRLTWFPKTTPNCFEEETGE